MYAVVTGSRADYYHLVPLLDELDAALIVTGSHLCPEFGYTVQDIVHPIAAHVECVLSSDTEYAAAKSAGIAVMRFPDVYREIKPDMVIVLGDRYEILAAALVAYMLGIPVAHIHGGEKTIGSLDDGYRHCITQLSSLHFVAAEGYRKRVIQLGAHPDTVHTVGAIGLHRIGQLLPRDELRKMFKLPDKPWCLVSYHACDYPVSELIEALRERTDLHYIVSLSGADSGNRAVNMWLKRFCKGVGATMVPSFGGLYIDIMASCALVIGNSSSGIIEAPHVQTPTVNVGLRQAGRIKGPSIYNVPPYTIAEAIDRALTCTEYRDVYYQPDTVKKIIDGLEGYGGKRDFYDVPVNC